MIERYTIVGKDMVPEKKEQARMAIEQEKQRGREPIIGEYKKLPEDERAIAFINEYIMEELRELGIDEGIPIDPDQIHFCSEDTYKRLAKEFFENSGQEIAAFHNANTGAVYVNADSPNRLIIYKNLIHELVHELSPTKYSVDDAAIAQVKSGYLSARPPQKDGDHVEHFRGLNEGVVEKIMRDVMARHGKDLIELFKITEDEQHEAKAYERKYTYYNEYIEILDVIAKGIARIRNEDAGAVWRRLKRGALTGDMMHLREIERVYGPGALRILAAIESGTKKISPAVLSEIAGFFNKTYDPSTQENVLERNLNEREFTAYKKRRKKIE